MLTPDRRHKYQPFIVLLLVMFSTYSQANDSKCGPVSPAEEQVIALQQENEILILKIKQMEATGCIPVELLRLKKIQTLQEIAANVKLQRQSVGDFEGFVKWMSANLAGYNRYIQAGSYTSVIAKMLPIPYAGQASIFTKFIAQFTLTLNAASVSITNYMNSSQKFIVMSESIEITKKQDKKLISEAAEFADKQLLKDMNDVHNKLAMLSDLSAGALSFLESINHYVSSTDEYWNKMKGVFKKDIDLKEKSFISENTNSLRIQADRFNGRLRNFEELGKKETASVKSLTVFDDLATEVASSQLR